MSEIMNANTLILIFTCVFSTFLQISVQSNQKCLVCKQVVKEIAYAVKKVDPKKTIQVGSFRIQPDGSQKQTQIKYAGSEVHLNEILETICDSFEDFAQAKNKETGELALLNLSEDVEKLSTHELVQDIDLNRSLKYYCESFIEDYEDDIIRIYKSTKEISNNRLDKELCSDSAGYCTHVHKEL